MPSMAGLFFDYFDGFLRVEFRMGSFDCIYMELSLHGDAVATTPCDDQFEKGAPSIRLQDDMTIHMRMSSVWCPFPSLIHWLEAIVVDVQECAFRWDAEGPDGELRWYRAGKSGRLKASWWTRDTIEREVRLNKIQLVRAFYESFRSFVDSDRFDPLSYESLSVGECIALVQDDVSLDVAAALAARCRTEAWELLMAMVDLAADGDRGFPRRAPWSEFVAKGKGKADQWLEEFGAEQFESQISHYLPVAWDGWDVERREKEVRDVLFVSDFMYVGFGSRLRELRSPLVEGWLTMHAA